MSTGPDRIDPVVCLKFGNSLLYSKYKIWYSYSMRSEITGFTTHVAGQIDTVSSSIAQSCSSSASTTNDFRLVDGCMNQPVVWWSKRRSSPLAAAASWQWAQWRPNKHSAHMSMTQRSSVAPRFCWPGLVNLFVTRSHPAPIYRADGPDMGTRAPSRQNQLNCACLEKRTNTFPVSPWRAYVRIPYEFMHIGVSSCSSVWDDVNTDLEYLSSQQAGMHVHFSQKWPGQPRPQS